MYTSTVSQIATLLCLQLLMMLVYVAAVWNNFRKVRLMIIDLILNLSKRLEDKELHLQEHENVRELVEATVASVPYHLTANPQIFTQQPGKGSGTVSPGRPIGGLLLMHPTYVISRLSVVSPQMQAYMRECLAWIGIHMGIGQAILFAKVGTFRIDQHV
jgi:hypothetical protein